MVIVWHQTWIMHYCKEINQNDHTLKLFYPPNLMTPALMIGVYAGMPKPLPVTVANGSLAWDPVLNMQ